jgi:hypothetical protein
MPAPREISHEQLEAIGRITCNAAEMEFYVKELIEMFTGVKDDSLNPLLASMDFRPLLNALANIGKIKTRDDPKTRKKLETALSKAGDANDKRNIVVHTYWLATDEGTVLGWKYPRGRPKAFRLQHYELDARQLSVIADEMREAIKLLGRLFVDMLMQEERKEAEAQRKGAHSSQGGRSRGTRARTK